MRSFNIAGPCQEDIHYTLPPERRLPNLLAVVERREYFVLHAPRQSGKTTLLERLTRSFNATGRYAAVTITVEGGDAWVGDIARMEDRVLGSLQAAALETLPPALRPPHLAEHVTAGSRIHLALAEWARACPLPLVLLLDEVDALQDAPLLSLLRQIRSGFPSRPAHFPQSMALVGMRDLRDYRIASNESDRLVGGSPFNIKVASFTLGNFSRSDVAELLGQHTTETGQPFEPAAIDRLVALTAGQPWLVNALARECVTALAPPGPDGVPGRPVTPSDIEAASEAIIRRIDSHLDSLDRRLLEPRVRAVLAPILAGELPVAVPEADLRYVRDLGLIVFTPSGAVDIANPIYRQVIPRELEAPIRRITGTIPVCWLTPDGRLDADALVAAFLPFWRQHGGALTAAAPYREIAAQLVMMAFLDRVANGGGTVDREYAVNRGRIDLCVRWGDQRLAFELKTWRAGEADPLDEGKVQLDGYLAGLGLDEGWLVIFDQRPGREIVGMVPEPERTASGRTVRVLRA